MSRCVVFCGPSLPVPTIKRWLPKAEVRPPANYGDVYRATMQGAVTIGIIDGVCDESGSVWHKEILWALERGVFVYGSAGVGAVRAAELHRFGMIGVGRIFGWFRDGSVEAEDEIMVVHAAREDAYRARSDSLVNIRATLERAVAAWAISETDAHNLIRVARTQYYATRTYASLLENAGRRGAVASETLARFTDWLSSGLRVPVDQMRIDAEAMIRRIASAAHDARGTGAAAFELECTGSWDELTRRIASEESAAAHAQRELPAGALVKRESAAALEIAAVGTADRAGAMRTHVLAQESAAPFEISAAVGAADPASAPRARVLTEFRSAAEPAASLPTSDVPAQSRGVDPAARNEPGGSGGLAGPLGEAELFAAIDRAVAESARGSDAPHSNSDDAALLAALERAAPELAGELLRECVERALSLLLAQRHAHDAEPRDIRAASDGFRFEYGLLSDAQTEAWLGRRGIDVERFIQWMRDDAMMSKAGALVRAVALRQLRRVYEARVLAAQR